MATKGKNNCEYHSLLTASKKDLARKRPVKTGLLKKFFAWIAHGTNQSANGSRSCPT